jgi:hypothetical protein
MEGTALRDRNGVLGNPKIHDSGWHEMIKTWEEYAELEQICDEADDRIKSGAWASGIHFELMHIIGKHGIRGCSREDTVVQGRKLLTEFYNDRRRISKT